ncbi:MAG: HlyD family efflux transporter periplasmic adaptor subunit [Planctomyces sp.]|nr:HlyD family efflux transporter periplasmic adaptor subunit [Planctomyces sp.]
MTATVLARPSWVPFLSKKTEARPGLVYDFVKSGPFLISLTVQGQLDSQKNYSLVNQVEGTTTIISIVPEGTKVEKGDIVCELDASALWDKARQQEITLTTAEAAYTKATEDLKIQLNQNDSDISAAMLALQLAELDLEKFVKGEFPQQQSALAGKVEIAKEQYVQAKESYEFTKRQVEKGTTQQNVLEAARIKMQQAEFDRESASKELEVLEDYTKKRTEAELEAQAKELANELERVKIKAEAAETQFRKDLEAKELTLKVERDKLERYNKQIEACTLRAPQDGEVVYANLSEGGRGRGGQQGPAVEVGATVYERQPIINLPDVTQMKVSCRIHESLIGAVRRGLAARVRVDAFAQDPYTGIVSSVSSVPMTGRWPNMDLREYDTQVFLTDDPERIRRLRPGLTAQVEILVDNRDSVLQVPMQAIVAVADKHVAYVLTPQQTVVERIVEIGATNNSHVEILKGLSNDERVVLNSRTHFARDIAALETRLIAEKPKRLMALTNEAAKTADPAPAVNPGAVAAPGAGPGGAQIGAAPGGGPGSGGGGPRLSPRERFAELDADKDGSLTQAELPEAMQAGFAEMDANADGKVSVEEFSAAIERFRSRGPGGGGPPGAGGPGAAAAPAPAPSP